MVKKLEKRVAIVTGAAGALGRATTAELRESGVDVVGVDVVGGDCEQFDIASKEGCAAMVARTLEMHGQLDILVLNAGVQHASPIESFDDVQWQRVLDVCLNGPFYAIKAAWPALTGTPGGRIVATASTLSFRAEANKAAYNAAKHGLLGLIKTAAVEGGQLGLTANAVAPGWMMTPLVEKQLADQMRLREASRDEVLAAFLEEQPVKRFVETTEVAATISFLASPAASAINGVCVPVDLGALA
ncbi:MULTISPECIES: SDR family NAD(P)-dependent oxidoreductase [Amycolatopsis]